jgi:nucleoside-diphosphate-sugar epimerase
MRFTVIGATGFIGSALTGHLQHLGHEVFAPARGSSDLFRVPLGHVIYAAGITADFRTRPFDTLRANLGLLSDVLERSGFASLLYLSSTRLYRHAATSDEIAAICVRPEDAEDLYDLTKLTAEALCHASKRDGVRVARISNVVGRNFQSRTFLIALIREACETGEIALHTAPESTKDYVLLEDVVGVLPAIAVDGRQACYNVGSGSALTHAQVLTPIIQATGARVRVDAGAARITSPAADITRLQGDFDYRPSPVLSRIADLVTDYRKTLNAQD